jgi:hypothetical protein
VVLLAERASVLFPLRLTIILFGLLVFSLLFAAGMLFPARLRSDP